MHMLYYTKIAKEIIKGMEHIKNNANDDIEVDLLEIFYALLNKWWVLLIGVLAGVIAAVAITVLCITPEYSATSMIYMRGSGSTIASIADLQIGSALTDDYEVIFKSRTLLTKTIDDLGIDMNYKSLESMISISNPSDTRILQVTITCPDAQLACDLVNALVANGMEAAEEIDSKEPYIIDKAVVQNSPVSPNMIKNVGIGGLAGLIIFGAVIVIRYMMNDTFQSSNDIEKYLELPVLCSVPESKSSQYEVRVDKKRSKREKKHGKDDE